MNILVYTLQCYHNNYYKEGNAFYYIFYTINVGCKKKEYPVIFITTWIIY